MLETSFLNGGREPRIDAPEDIKEYFERLYRAGELDEKAIQDARQAFRFAEVGANYRLIEDGGEPAVVATWDGRRAEVEALLGAARGHPTRANLRRLAPFQVNLRRYERDQADRAITEDVAGLLVWRGGYDEAVGLTADNADALLLV